MVFVPTGFLTIATSSLGAERLLEPFVLPLSLLPLEQRKLLGFSYEPWP